MISAQNNTPVSLSSLTLQPSFLGTVTLSFTPALSAEQTLTIAEVSNGVTVISLVISPIF
jgi:hypothetical protein